MRQIAWPNIPPKLDEAWRRFRALSWRWKAPALSLAALCALGVALLVVAVATGGDGDAGSAGGSGARHGRAAFALTPSPAAAPTPAPTLAPAPTPTPTPEPGDGTQPPAEPTPTATPAPPAAPPPRAATPVAGAYTLTRVLPSANFDRMLAFALIPGSTTHGVIVTQGGVIRRVPLSGSGAATVYGDVSSRVIDFSAENEGGLLGLAFSPNLQADHRVYLYFTSNDCGIAAARCDVLARYTVSGNTITTASEVVIMEVADPYPNHNGGQILFGPDGLLYIGLGDGGSGGDPNETGQNRNDLLGSILRINVTGQTTYNVPADNPWPGNPVWAYGLRNPWRFSFDRETRQLWAGDVGQNKWEEVDRIVAGGNYGWDCYEGTVVYNDPSPGAACPSSGFRMPRAVYSHSEGCSVTGGYVYRGPSMPELDGWYVYADFCSGQIWAVNTVGSAAPVLLADTGLPIASFGELPDGELLVLTFANAVYRLAR